MTNIGHPKFDVVCAGELVVDLIPSAPGSTTYYARAGGAPGNVAAGVARLGKQAAMLSRVGDDAFGDLLVSVLEGQGVDISGVARGKNEKSGLAVVSLGKDGDRKFTFYREGAADLLIGPGDLGHHALRDSSVLHVGTSAMSSPRPAAAHINAVAAARAMGKHVSVDPNLRPALWHDTEAMLRTARNLIANATIVKVTEEELSALAGGTSMRERVRTLWHPELMAVAVTKGPRGAELFTDRVCVSCNGFAVDTIDATGAGDAFTACLLCELLDANFEFDDRRVLERALMWSCAAGALATTKRGAIESLPDRTDIAKLLKVPPI